MEKSDDLIAATAVQIKEVEKPNLAKPGKNPPRLPLPIYCARKVRYDKVRLSIESHSGCVYITGGLIRRLENSGCDLLLCGVA